MFDTLFDTSISEEQPKDKLVSCPLFSLLVIRLDVRFTEEEKITVKLIKENFEEDVA